MAGIEALTESVNDALRNNRPDRYEDDTWIHDFIPDLIESGVIDPAEAIAELTYMVAKKGEGNARRRANGLMGKYFDTPQLSLLDWRPQADDPIFVERAVRIGDEIVTKGEYVALRAATPEDLVAWSDAKQDRADRNHEREIQAVKGARQMAEDMRRAGFRRFSEWAVTVSVAA